MYSTDMGYENSHGKMLVYIHVVSILYMYVPSIEVSSSAKWTKSHINDVHNNLISIIIPFLGIITTVSPLPSISETVDVKLIYKSLNIIPSSVETTHLPLVLTPLTPETV